jgi:hypothetical protein
MSCGVAEFQLRPLAGLECLVYCATDSHAGTKLDVATRSGGVPTSWEQCPHRESAPTMRDLNPLWTKLRRIMRLLFSHSLLSDANLGELWLVCGPKLTKIRGSSRMRAEMFTYRDCLTDAHFVSAQRCNDRRGPTRRRVEVAKCQSRSLFGVRCERCMGLFWTRLIARRGIGPLWTPEVGCSSLCRLEG